MDERYATLSSEYRIKCINALKNLTATTGFKSLQKKMDLTHYKFIIAHAKYKDEAMKMGDHIIQEEISFQSII